jgi:hypothetical protein
VRKCHKNCEDACKSDESTNATFCDTRSLVGDLQNPIMLGLEDEDNGPCEDASCRAYRACKSECRSRQKCWDAKDEPKRHQCWDACRTYCYKQHYVPPDPPDPVVPPSGGI